jgi:RimJ/RimL family protein N-acetyltransferase
MTDGLTVHETDRLLLRSFLETDFDAIIHVFGNEEVMKFGIGVQTEVWVRTWLRERVQMSLENPGWGPLAIVVKHSMLVVGYCGLIQYPDVNGRSEVEIGYRLARPHWRQGFATEAVTAVRNYAFGKLGLSRVIAMIDPRNFASIRVAEKVGMRSEGEEVMFDGYTHPDRIYFVEKGDF